MKIAIPIWEGKVSPLFDTASKIMVFDVEDDTGATFRFQATLSEQDLRRRCSRLKGLGIELLICGAISWQLRDMLLASGIKVIPWISGQTDEVVQAYVKGTLNDPKFLMPGCEENDREELERIFRKQ